MSLLRSIHLRRLHGRLHRVHVVNIDANTNTIAPIGIHVIHDVGPPGGKGLDSLGVLASPKFHVVDCMGEDNSWHDYSFKDCVA